MLPAKISAFQRTIDVDGARGCLRDESTSGPGVHACRASAFDRFFSRFIFGDVGSKH